jgi:hypothetical protein
LRAPFDPDGERRVSEKKPVWFRNGGDGKMHASHHNRGPGQSKIYGESKEPDL